MAPGLDHAGSRSDRRPRRLPHAPRAVRPRGGGRRLRAGRPAGVDRRRDPDHDAPGQPAHDRRRSRRAGTATDDHSEPEPDVAVVEGGIRDYRDAHPTTALLVVEVSDDSLHRDRTTKQRLYARCGIPEYWVLTLPDARLEICRDPRAGVYATVTTHGAGERVAPLTRPGAAVAVDDLLP